MRCSRIRGCGAPAPSFLCCRLQILTLLMTDLTFLTATTMVAQIREKKLSPVELTEAHLAKIARLNPNLNAFVQVDPKRVRREAREADAAIAEEIGRASCRVSVLNGVAV